MCSKRIFTVILAISLLTLTACGSGSSSNSSSSGEQAAGGVAVEVETVNAATISNENRVSGRVAAETQTSVMVGTSAQVTAVFVEVGDTVQAGDRICTLDVSSTMDSYNAAVISRNSAAQSYNDQSSVFDAQISLYDTQIELLLSRIETAETNVRNLEALMEIGAVAQIEIDQAKQALDQSKAELEQLRTSKLSAQAQKNSTLSQLRAGMESYQANMDQLSTALENVDSSGHVVAPTSGTITSLTAVEKGMVMATAPVAVIESVEQMKIVVSVSEALIPKISVGDEVDVSIGTIGASYVGTIRNIDRAANVQTGLYSVTVSVPSDVTGLMSGMFADVTFRTDTSSDTLVVPTEAILSSGNIQYVFVVEGNTAKYIEVTTGLIGDGITEILTGLSEGQQLVTVGQSYLHDGDPVQIISEEG